MLDPAREKARVYFELCSSILPFLTHNPYIVSFYSPLPRIDAVHHFYLNRYGLAPTSLRSPPR
jgi:hypothetical protein